MTDKDKIKEYLDFKGISKNKFYKKTGLSSSFLDRGASLGVDKLRIIIDNYPDFNVNWLLTGQGNMLGEELETIPKEEIHFSKTYSCLPRKHKLIPFYEVDFVAGTFETLDENITTPARYMDIPEFSGCTAFRAYSDSMEKLIKSGAVLFSRKLENWIEHLEYGQIYGIITNDGRRYLKYIRRAENSIDNFLLRSENTDYDDFDIPKKAIRSLWLIDGWINKRT